MRAINTAQFAYLNGCGGGQYATSFVVLGTQQATEPAGYLSPDLAASATPQRNGYQFAMTQGQSDGGGAVDCMGQPTWSAYYASAVPVIYGSTGLRSFGTNQAGAIWQADGPTPPTEPFGPPAKHAE
jgi:hypothetical protein